MSASPMSAERTEIEAVIQEYFRGYLTAERQLVARAFHPETRLLSVEDGKLAKTEMIEWLENLESRKGKGDVRQADTEISTVDITDSAAVAKVTLTFQKYKFTDYLSLLRVQGLWRIVGKIYSVHPSA